MINSAPDIEGLLLDEYTRISVTEFSRVCDLTLDQVHHLVGEGLLHPQGNLPEDWSFASIEIKRTRRAIRLQRDLEVNLAGAALALDLLDEIERLRCRLRCLEQQLGSLSDAET